MRRIGRIAALATLLVLGIGLLGILLAPFFIERALRSELAERGIEQVEMDLSIPTLNRITAREVRIGGDMGFSADELAVEYRIPELIEGRIERIRLVRPRLRIEVSQDGNLSFGGLDPLLSGTPGGTAGGLGLPAPFEIVDGSITAATPAGEVTARLDGAVTLERGEGPLKLSIAGPWLTAELAVTLSQNGSNLAISGRVGNARIAHPLVSASAVGSFTMTLGADGPAVDARFTLSDVQSPRLSIGDGPASGALQASFEPGSLSADLRLTGSSGHVEASVLGDPTRVPRVMLAGDRLSIPQTLVEASFNAAFDLYPSGRRAVLVEPARIDGQLAPELRADMPDVVRSTLSEAPLVLRAEPGLTVQWSENGLHASGRMLLTQEESLAITLDGALNGAAGRLFGTVDITLNAEKLALAGAKMQDLSLNAALQLAQEPEHTQIRLTKPAPLSMNAVSFGVTHLSKLALTVQSAERPLLTLGPEELAFALAANAGKAFGRLGQEREPFTLAWKGAAVEGKSGAALTATLSGGRVVLSRLGWEAGGIAARLVADAAAAAPPELRLSIARLAQSGEKPVVTPLAIEGTVHPTDTLIRFDLRGRDSTGNVKLAMTGSHDLKRNRGSASLALDPVRFTPDDLQPATVVPALGAALRDAAGTISAEGELGWSDAGLTSDLEVTAERLSFLSPLGPVLGLEGRVRLNGISPISTPPAQRVTAAAVQAALPMNDLALQFGLREGRYIDLEEVGLAMAGGRVTVAPTTLDLEAERKTMTLEVADVRLPDLLDLLGLDRLTGTGRLAGKIPISFEERDVAIAGGRLESQEPGQIRYDPAQPPAALKGGGESVGLALAALRNFHYHRLILNLDREIGGEALVVLHVAGKNPDFYGGYPVEFNLSLSGKLEQILVEGLAGYRIPETLQDRLEQPSDGGGPSAP